MDPNEDLSRKNILIIVMVLAFLALFILIIILIPIINRFYEDFQRRRKSRNLLNRKLSDDSITEYELLIDSNCVDDKPEIKCAIEYKNRQSQLIVGLKCVNLKPLIKHANLTNMKEYKLFLLIYLNGDVTNFPCQSKKKSIESSDLFNSITINEIFIFTVMPYDLQNIDLKIQYVLVNIIGNKSINYNFGESTIDVKDFDNEAFSEPKLSSINNFDFNELHLLEECLFCLAITNTNNLFKIKFIRLFIIDCGFPDDAISGISFRMKLQYNITGKVVETTKKKYKSSLLFNDIFTFDKTNKQEEIISLEIELIESIIQNEIEIEKICGDVKTQKSMEDSLSRHIQESKSQFSSEVVKWHRICYTK